MSSECIFCRISRGEIKSPRIYENDNFFSIPDAHPKMKGHSLVITKKHFETVLDMPSSLGQEFLDCIKKTSVILMKKHEAEGFNVLINTFEASGQSVKHAHFHIMPRKKGDGVSWSTVFSA
jgi:histidine triad (HIT) family protein